LQNEQQPFKLSSTGAFINLEAFWRDYNAKRIESLNKSIRSSRKRVLSNDDKGSILVEDSESWTGISGPALYSWPSSKGSAKLTFDQAIARGGNDLRKDLP
jgi:hypothetical protein